MLSSSQVFLHVVDGVVDRLGVLWVFGHVPAQVNSKYGEYGQGQDQSENHPQTTDTPGMRDELGTMVHLGWG